MTYDVVIAGGGPVGLFLAHELGLRQIFTLVLERMETPQSPLKAGWMGMRGLNIPSVEAFYRRGMLGDVRRSSLAWMDAMDRPGFRMDNAPASAPRFAGHFAGIMLEAGKIDFSGQKYLVPGPGTTGGLISLEEYRGGAGRARGKTRRHHKARSRCYRFHRGRRRHYGPCGL
jgi:hypothetical protein